MQPETRYARSGGLSIAYQVIGDGELDLVFLPEWFNNLETQWEDPRLARFPERLSSFARVVMLNQRGMGLSDPIPLTDSMAAEEWIEDAGAVMQRLKLRSSTGVCTPPASQLRLDPDDPFDQQTPEGIQARGRDPLQPVAARMPAPARRSPPPVMKIDQREDL